MGYDRGRLVTPGAVSKDFKIFVCKIHAMYNDELMQRNSCSSEKKEIVKLLMFCKTTTDTEFSLSHLFFFFRSDFNKRNMFKMPGNFNIGYL